MKPNKYLIIAAAGLSCAVGLVVTIGAQTASSENMSSCTERVRHPNILAVHVWPPASRRLGFFQRIAQFQLPHLGIGVECAHVRAQLVVSGWPVTRVRNWIANVTP